MKVVLHLATYIPRKWWGVGWHCGANLGGGCRELGNSLL